MGAAGGRARSNVALDVTGPPCELDELRRVIGAAVRANAAGWLRGERARALARLVFTAATVDRFAVERSLEDRLTAIERRLGLVPAAIAAPDQVQSALPH